MLHRGDSAEPSSGRRSSITCSQPVYASSPGALRRVIRQAKHFLLKIKPGFCLDTKVSSKQRMDAAVSEQAHKTAGVPGDSWQRYSHKATRGSNCNVSSPFVKKRLCVLSYCPIFPLYMQAREYPGLVPQALYCSTDRPQRSASSWCRLIPTAYYHSNTLKNCYVCVCREKKKRMLRDHRELQGPWVDLPLPRFLSLR